MPKKQCKRCNKRFENETEFKDHMKWCREIRYPCSICGKVLGSKDSLRKHSKAHDQPNIYKCDKCDKELSNMFSKNRHMKTCVDLELEFFNNNPIRTSSRISTCNNKSQHSTDSIGSNNKSQHSTDSIGSNNKSQHSTDSIGSNNKSQHSTDSIGSNNKSQHSTDSIGSNNKSQHSTHSIGSNNERQHIEDSIGSNNKSQHSTDSIGSNNKSQHSTDSIGSNNKSQHSTDSIGSNNKSQHSTDSIGSNNKSQHSTDSIGSNNKSQHSTDSIGSNNKRQHSTDNVPGSPETPGYRWRVSASWILDLQQYNEWMAEEDYEVDESGKKKMHKMRLSVDDIMSFGGDEKKKSGGASTSNAAKTERRRSPSPVASKPDKRKRSKRDKTKRSCPQRSSNKPLPEFGQKCTVCEATLTTKCHLKRHINLKHNKNAIVHKCTMCKATFTLIYNLKRHINSKHNKNAPKIIHKCTVCEATFLVKSHLKKHKLIHKRHLECDCGQVFNKEEELSDHKTKCRNNHNCVKGKPLLNYEEVNQEIMQNLDNADKCVNLIKSTDIGIHLRKKKFFCSQIKQIMLMKLYIGSSKYRRAFCPICECEDSTRHFQIHQEIFRRGCVYCNRALKGDFKDYYSHIKRKHPLDMKKDKIIIVQRSRECTASSSSSSEDETTPDDLKHFVGHFKRRRAELGFGRKDVSKQLAEMNLKPITYYTIGRFERLQHSFSLALKYKRLLQEWLKYAEENAAVGGNERNGDGDATDATHFDNNFGAQVAEVDEEAVNPEENAAVGGNERNGDGDATDATHFDNNFGAQVAEVDEEAVNPDTVNPG